MKDRFKNFITFNKSERYGLIVLFTIILLLIAARIYVNTAGNNMNIDEKKVAAAGFKPQAPPQVHPVTTSSPPIHHTDTSRFSYTLFPFDPNTVDSPALLRLGLSEKTTSIFLHWRARGKVFRKKEDLKGLYTLSTAAYTRLAPYIVIKGTSPSHSTILYPSLNTADSFSLLKIRGIGPRLAHRILEYRNRHGPFHSYNDLFNVYNFPDSTFNRIKEHFTIN